MKIKTINVLVFNNSEFMYMYSFIDDEDGIKENNNVIDKYSEVSIYVVKSSLELKPL